MLIVGVDSQTKLINVVSNLLIKLNSFTTILSDNYFNALV